MTTARARSLPPIRASGDRGEVEKPPQASSAADGTPRRNRRAHAAMDIARRLAASAGAGKATVPCSRSRRTLKTRAQAAGVALSLATITCGYMSQEKQREL